MRLTTTFDLAGTNETDQALENQLADLHRTAGLSDPI